IERGCLRQDEVGQDDLEERMKKIHKYVFSQGLTIQTFFIPQDRIILHVGPDPSTGLPAMWFQVETNSIEKEVTYIVIPTGGCPAGSQSFVGTAICGKYVWHIYRNE